MPAPRGLTWFCSTHGSLLPTFHRISAQLRFPLPPPTIAPGFTALLLAPWSFQSRGRVCPARFPFGTLWCVASPLWASPISPCVAPPAPRPPALRLPFPAPVPGQTTFPCTCNPITDCPVSLEVIPPKGTTSLLARLALREELPTLWWYILPQHSSPWHSFLVGNIETKEVHLVTVTHPFRTEYKYSYLTYLTQHRHSFRLFYKTPSGKRKGNGNKCKMSRIRPDFQRL